MAGSGGNAGSSDGMGGQGGFGGLGIGNPGSYGGEQSVGAPGFGGGYSTGSGGGGFYNTVPETYADIMAAMSQSVPVGADRTASGDPTSKGFGGTVAGGSVGEGGQSPAASAKLGREIGKNVLNGTMTAEEGNLALSRIGEQNSGLAGILGLAAANLSAAYFGTPKAARVGASALAPFTGLLSIGALFSAISGQGMLGVGPSENESDLTGYDAKRDFVYSELQKHGLGISQVDNLLSSFGNKEVEMMKSTMFEDSMLSSINAIRDADTNIEYNHTLADLSGIQMDEQEKELLYAQKEIAIDRAITEIEDTFSLEGEAMVAQQIQNLGENALGGTIGQGFVKRWQEREAAAKTGALQDIESTYLSAERQAIDAQKQRQVDIWGKEFEADKSSAELELDKAKSTALLDFQWGELGERSRQSELDRALRERMGGQEISAWDEANLWSAGGSVAGAVIGSDWFSDAVSGWLS